MKNNRKNILASFILGLTVLSSASLLISSFNNNAEETHAQTLPTNVNVTDLTDSQVNAYYSGVSGKSQDQLLSALNQIIDGHREYRYDSTTDRTAYKIIDRNWSLSPLSSAQLSNFSYVNDNPFIKKLYADYNNSAETADYFKNPGASEVSFDKEHIWAQSMGNFGRTGGAGSDFHALWPADTRANSIMHSNYNYAVPQTSISTYTGDLYNGNDRTIPSRGTYVGRNGYISGYSQKVCEPLDQYKGDIARAMFYMPARYYTYADTLHPKLTLVNGYPLAVTASASQAGLAGDLATLLSWNELDPVDAYEIHRNNLIYNNFQLNRNPFIDHPEWARIAYDTSYSGPGASTASGSSSVGDGGQTVLVSSISLSDSALTLGVSSQHTLTTTVLPINATNKNLNWTSTYQSVATVLNGVISALLAGTSTITATAADGSGISASCSLTVTNEAQKNLDYIQVSGATATATYGSTYSTSSIVVTAYYDDLSSKNVTSSSTINTPNTNVLGQQSISATYLTETGFYSVNVTNNGAILPPQVASDLFISEYIEGSSNSKALEIYNGTGAPINLLANVYSVKLYSNGSSTVTTNLNLPDYSLANGDSYVIANSSSSSAILALDDITSGVCNFNGNDTIGLYKNGVLIDLIGVIGTDPVSAWTATAAETANGFAGSTLDRTLVRSASTSGPKATFSWSEWNVYAIDTTSYLGSHAMTLEGSEAKLNQAEAWASYFLAQTSEQCSALQPQESEAWTRLNNEFNWMSDGSKAYYTSGVPTTIIQSAKDRYSAIIAAHPENLPFIVGYQESSFLIVTANKINSKILMVSFAISIAGIVGFLFVYKKKRVVDEADMN